jgi:hypothetical protein
MSAFPFDGRDLESTGISGLELGILFFLFLLESCSTILVQGSSSGAFAKAVSTAGRNRGVHVFTLLLFLVLLVGVRKLRK